MRTLKSPIKIPGLFRVFIFWYRERRFAATIRRDVTMHVIQALKAIPDPRRRHGRRCPLVSLLAIVLRAAMPLVRRCRGYPCMSSAIGLT